jgi:hypothetical protein
MFMIYERIMLNQQSILLLAKKKDRITTRDLAKRFGVSRQYASMIVRELVGQGALVKIGSTLKAYYVLPEKAALHGAVRTTLRLSNTNLQEHEVLRRLQKSVPALSALAPSVSHIFIYAFSEMMNNAIEHSKAKTVVVECSVGERNISFSIRDTGIGVFRNVKHTRRLETEIEAMQDILKGKTTTKPEGHTGEGIFFTSKISDVFILDSFEYVLRVDNERNDTIIGRSSSRIRGTTVSILIHTKTQKNLPDLFREYTDDSAVFSKTEIIVRLFLHEGQFVSRSEGRRLLQGLEKFSSIILDFDRVPAVGQAFVDEIFRVFRATHPAIVIQAINANDVVRFMVERGGGTIRE